MKTVYAFSCESESSGAVNWYYKELDRDLALCKYEATPGDEMNVFAVDVPDDANAEAIDTIVDDAMWDRDYVPTLRYRIAEKKTAKSTGSLTVSTPENNPNHPRIRCIDAQSTTDDAMVSAFGQNVCAPFRVFDILNQEYVGPEFDTRDEAHKYLHAIGGAYCKE